MSISVDATSESTPTSGVSSISWLHTCSVSASVLSVQSKLRNTSAGNEVITSVTFNGVALSKVRHDAGASGDVRTEIWDLVNPDDGQHSIVITYTGIVDNNIDGSAISLIGVDASDPRCGDNGAGDAGTPGTTGNVVVSTDANNNFVVDAVYTTDDNLTVDGQQTAFSSRQLTVVSIDAAGASYKAGNQSGNVSMTWTWLNSSPWAMSAVAYKPSSGAAKQSMHYKRLRA